MASCLWCEQRADSNEHLVPVWIRDLFATHFPEVGGFEIAFDLARPAGSNQLWAYSSGKLELKVKVVCRGCNSGWMSALERRAKPVLTPLILGATCHTVGPELATLAHWAAKTSVLVDGLEADSVVLSTGDIDTIRSEGAPRGFLIRLGYRDAIDGDLCRILTTTVAAALLGEAVAAEPNAFVVTISLGHVVMSVAGGPALDDPDRWARDPEASLSVWPPAPAGIRWPPVIPRLSSAKDVRDFHEQMWVRTTNPDFPRPGTAAE